MGIEPQARPCPHCQQPVAEDRTICPNCGAAVAPAAPRQGGLRKVGLTLLVCGLVVLAAFSVYAVIAIGVAVVGAINAFGHWLLHPCGA